MTRSLAIGLVLTLTAATPGRAQELSAREAAWVTHLGERLGGPASGGRVALPVPEAVASEQREASGLRVTVGALVVHRVRFESAAVAHEAAARVELGTPIVGEVRGEQAVFITGQPLRDAALARRALDEAWRGLPVRAPASATFACLGEGELALATCGERGSIEAAIDHALGRAAGAAPTLELPTGRSQVRRDEHGAWLWLTPDPARAAALSRYLEVLSRRSPRRGLEDVVSGALGR